MTLEDSCVCYTCKLCIVEGIDVACSAIAHARTQSTNKLIDDLLHSAFVRNSSGNAFRYKFLDIFRVALEVAVF